MDKNPSTKSEPRPNRDRESPNKRRRSRSPRNRRDSGANKSDVGRGSNNHRRSGRATSSDGHRGGGDSHRNDYGKRRRSRSPERWGRRESRGRYRRSRSSDRKGDYWYSDRRRSPDRRRSRDSSRSRGYRSRDERSERRDSYERFPRSSSLEDTYRGPRDLSPSRNYFDSYDEKGDGRNLDQGLRQFPGGAPGEKTIDLPGLGGLRGYDIVELKETPSVQQALEVLRQYNIKGYQLVMKEQEFDKQEEPSSVPPSLPPDNFGSLGPPPIPPYSTNYDLPNLRQEETGPKSKRVLVDNIDFRATRFKLEEVFKIAGKVINVLVKHDQQSAAYSATVEYEQPFEAVRAVNLLNGQMLFSRAISVSIAEMDEPPFPIDDVKKDDFVPNSASDFVGPEKGLRGEPPNMPFPPERLPPSGGMLDLDIGRPMPGSISGRVGFSDMDSGNRFGNLGIPERGMPFQGMESSKNLPLGSMNRGMDSFGVNRSRLGMMDSNVDVGPSGLDRGRPGMGMGDVGGGGAAPNMPQRFTGGFGSMSRTPGGRGLASNMDGPFRGHQEPDHLPDRGDSRRFDGPPFGMGPRDTMPRGGHFGSSGGTIGERMRGDDAMPGRDGMGRGMMDPFPDRNRLGNDRRDEFSRRVDETKGYVNTPSGDLRKVVTRETVPPSMGGAFRDSRRPGIGDEFEDDMRMMGSKDMGAKPDLHRGRPPAGFMSDYPPLDDRRGGPNVPNLLNPNREMDDRMGGRPLGGGGPHEGRLGRPGNFQNDFNQPFGGREPGRLSPRHPGFSDTLSGGRRGGDTMGNVPPYSGSFNASFDERNRLGPMNPRDGFGKEKHFDDGFDKRRGSARDFFNEPFSDRFVEGNRNPPMNSRMACSVLVKNLPFDITVKTLKERFLDIGELDSVEMKPKGMAYIKFCYERDAQRAIDLMNGRYINGRAIQVSMC